MGRIGTQAPYITYIESEGMPIPERATMAHVCEICGERSVQTARDMKEVQDVTSRDASAWEWDGAPHYRCKSHRYEPKLTYLDGTVTGGFTLDQDEQRPIGTVGEQMTDAMRAIRDLNKSP